MRVGFSDRIHQSAPLDSLQVKKNYYSNLASTQTTLAKSPSFWQRIGNFFTGVWRFVKVDLWSFIKNYVLCFYYDDAREHANKMVKEINDFEAIVREEGIKDDPEGVNTAFRDLSILVKVEMGAFCEKAKDLEKSLLREAIETVARAYGEEDVIDVVYIETKAGHKYLTGAKALLNFDHFMSGYTSDKYLDLLEIISKARGQQIEEGADI